MVSQREIDAKAKADTPRYKPECKPLSCTAEAEIQAVILYPALGTPYVAPASETKIRLFLLVEDFCEKTFFGSGQDNLDPARICINRHLHLMPFKGAKKTSAKLGIEKLYPTDGDALESIGVWHNGVQGSGWTDHLIDHNKNIVANLRPGTVKFYVNGTLGDGTPLKAAFPSKPNHAITDNMRLKHLFEVELDIAKLRVQIQPGAMYTLAWMVTCAYKKETMAFTEHKDKHKPTPVTHWEHQDKLVYDFFQQMKEEKAGRNHFAKPFAFNLDSIKPNQWPRQMEDEANRLKPFHPVIFIKDKDRLDIGHLTDPHVSCRQFALAKADAAVLEGISPPVGPMLANCLVNFKALFDQFQTPGASKVDVLFLTGDLIDHNRNLDPSMVKGKSPLDQWTHYNLAANLDTPGYYPRGLDDMLVYSLVKRAYEHNMPVFMVTGNHEAYDEPFGISPRVNSYSAKRAANPNARAVTVSDALGAAKDHEPQKDAKSYNPNDVGDIDLNWSPNFSSKRANEGIPADHNLTIYEACLIYGPTHPQIMQSWDFMPDNFDWFYTLFTPLADFTVSFKDQRLTGLEWGNAERMLEGSFLPDGMLPRANEAMSWNQLALLRDTTFRDAKQHLLFTHFTAVGYNRTKPFSKADKRKATEVSDAETYGAFVENRLELFKWVREGKIHGHFSGHSHRSGSYKVTLKQEGIVFKDEMIHTEGRDPAKQPVDPDAQFWIASCCGGMGIQNLEGELEGWNLMPSSGNRIEGATGKVKVVAAPKTAGAKPRFCVALDYMQRIDEKSVLAWTLQERYFRLKVMRLPHAVPFIDKVTFHVWDEETPGGKGSFKDYPLALTKESTEKGVRYQNESLFYYECTSDKMEALTSAITKGSVVFARVEFNQELAKVESAASKAKLYDQFNFDDPWLFRVRYSETTGEIRCDPKGEVPDWDWLWNSDKTRYPNFVDITSQRSEYR
jgi:hypothetical protein